MNSKRDRCEQTCDNSTIIVVCESCLVEEGVIIGLFIGGVYWC